MPVCDICDKSMNWGEGFGLTTSEVVLCEAYWEFIFRNQWSYVHEMDPEGKTLGSLVVKQASQNSTWLVCKSCAELFEFDEIQAWKFNTENAFNPDNGPADVSSSGFAAAYAWSKLYDSWPITIQTRKELPSGDYKCDFCRRALYLDEKFAMMKKDVIVALENQGALKRRGPASTNIYGNSFWVCCSTCSSRANRIISKSVDFPWVPHKIKQRYRHNKHKKTSRKWWQFGKGSSSVGNTSLNKNIEKIPEVKSFKGKQKICINCGTYIKEGDLKCINCGSSRYIWE